MFKHRISLNPAFAVLFLICLIYFRQINWLYFYFSYFLIYGLGIGLGLHRIICHNIRMVPLFEKLCIVLGVLSHAGSLKGSILWHTNHHFHADSYKDTHKNFFTALMPKVVDLQLPLSVVRKNIVRVDRDAFLKAINDYYYVVLLAIYTIIFLIFGLKNLFFYVVAPGAMALIAHSYGALIVHRFGYKNFDTNDNSKNNLFLFPFLFGENWHNNHHRHHHSAANQINNQIRWWELDLIYQVSKFFYSVENVKK